MHETDPSVNFEREVGVLVEYDAKVLSPGVLLDGERW